MIFCGSSSYVWQFIELRVFTRRFTSGGFLTISYRFLEFFVGGGQGSDEGVQSRNGGNSPVSLPYQGKPWSSNSEVSLKEVPIFDMKVILP